MGQIPHGIRRLKAQSDITKWVEVRPWFTFDIRPFILTKISQQSSDKPRAILLNTSTKIPLLWKVIANKYNHRMKFGNFHDERGSYFEGLGLEDNSKSDNRVLFYAPGSTDPVLFEGECVALEAL